MRFCSISPWHREAEVRFGRGRGWASPRAIIVAVEKNL
jgi:hypothetical protein